LSTATEEKTDDKAKEKAKDGKSEELQRLEAELADLEKELADLEDADDVEAEEVPADTGAELERVKQLVGAHFGIDTRSPGQVKQASLDGLEAEIELKQQQIAEQQAADEEAAAAAKAEEEAAAAASKSSKSK